MRQLLQQDHHAWLLSQFLFLREVPVETLYLSYVIHVRVIMRSYCLSSCSCGRLPQGLLYSFMQPLTRFSKRSYCLSSCSCGSSHRDFVLVICNPRQDYHAWLLFQFLFLREVPVGTFVFVICNPCQDHHAQLLSQFLFLREVPVGNFILVMCSHQLDSACVAIVSVPVPTGGSCRDSTCLATKLIHRTQLLFHCALMVATQVISGSKLPRWNIFKGGSSVPPISVSV